MNARPKASTRRACLGRNRPTRQNVFPRVYAPPVHLNRDQRLPNLNTNNAGIELAHPHPPQATESTRARQEQDNAVFDDHHADDALTPPRATAPCFATRTTAVAPSSVAPARDSRSTMWSARSTTSTLLPYTTLRRSGCIPPADHPPGSSSSVFSVRLDDHV